MADVLARLTAVLAGRSTVERELGEGGTAAVLIGS